MNYIFFIKGSILLQTLEGLLAVNGQDIDVVKDTKNRINAYVSKCFNVEQELSSNDSISEDAENFLGNIQVEGVKMFKKMQQEATQANEKIFVERIFTKSLEEAATRFTCQHCSTTTQFKFKPFQDHMRKHHPTFPNVSSKDNPDQDRIICLLPKEGTQYKCNASVRKSDFCRHLLKQHQQGKPGPNMAFKGFFSISAGQDYYVAWGRLKEADPPQSELIEVLDGLGEPTILNPVPDANHNVHDFETTKDNHAETNEDVPQQTRSPANEEMVVDEVGEPAAEIHPEVHVHDSEAHETNEDALQQKGSPVNKEMVHKKIVRLSDQCELNPIW